MKTSSFILAVSLLIVMVFVFTSCSDFGDEVTGPDPQPGPLPTLVATWSGENGIANYLLANCAPCHTSESFGGFNVSSYDNITDGNQIDDGDADESLMIQRMEGTVGSIMPPQPSDPLPQEDINVIREWIDDGAEDN